MKKSEIRNIILCHSKVIKELLLTETMINLVKEIKAHGYIKAAKVAEFKDISVQNASTQLNKLFLKGYLKREETTAETGGIEYIYCYNFPNQSLNNQDEF